MHVLKVSACRQHAFAFHARCLTLGVYMYHTYVPRSVGLLLAQFNAARDQQDPSPLM
jgi:hypothetical protein